MVGLRFFELLGVKWLSAHLEQNRADAVDSAQVIGILLQDTLKFVDGFFAAPDIFLRRGAGNVLAGVGSGPIKTGVKQVRIEVLGLFEIFDGGGILPVFKGRPALI